MMFWRENFFTTDHVNVILSENRKIEVMKNTKHVKNLVTYVRNNLISRGEFSSNRKLGSYYKQLQIEKNIPVKGVAHKDVQRKCQL